MSNIIHMTFPSNDIKYITGSEGEPVIVGVQCEEISIQLTPCLNKVMLGSSTVSKDELMAFVLCSGIYEELIGKLGA